MIDEILSKFKATLQIRRLDPTASLRAAGEVVQASLVELEAKSERREIAWRGSGAKTYDVYSLPGSNSEFSRGVNRDLFLSDPAEFAERWQSFLGSLERSRQSGVLSEPAGNEIDRLFYTGVVGFGAMIDLFATGNRGGPGTFFECLVGPTVAALIDRPERSSVKVPLPGTTKQVRVPTDLSFPPGQPQENTLVIPTKISTRERISQAYVHQRILDSDGSRSFKSALCVANENNMGGGRSLETAYLKDTLVPDTIVQYEAFIAKLSGLYYLDPPTGYLPPRELFPPVKPFHNLLTGDLPDLAI